MQLSVIIPVYNDFASLNKCLAALQPQLAQHHQNAECLVVDNGSNHFPNDLWQQYPEIRFLVETAPGSYAARNSGARAATGEFFVFTDSDCIPDPDWLATIIRITALHPETDLHVGAIRLFADVENGKEPDQAIFTYEVATAFRQRYYAETVHFGPTANLIVRRKTFTELGGFNQELLSGGDKEFGRRAWRAGYVLHYSPECSVRHPTRANKAQLENKTRRIVGGDARKANGDALQTMKDMIRYLFLRPLNSIRLIWTKVGFSTSQRLAASGIALQVIGWQISERIRLIRGETAKR